MTTEYPKEKIEIEQGWRPRCYGWSYNFALSNCQQCIWAKDCEKDSDAEMQGPRK